MSKRKTKTPKPFRVPSMAAAWALPAAPAPKPQAPRKHALEEIMEYHPEDANERYERLAEEFYRATGMLAPGKDSPAAFGTDPYERRLEAWTKWRAERDAKPQAPERMTDPRVQDEAFDAWFRSWPDAEWEDVTPADGFRAGWDAAASVARARESAQEREIERLRSALRAIADPVAHLKAETAKRGPEYRYDPLAGSMLTKDPEWLKGLARAALKEET